eukprot:Hpha_TRINITY_DN16782_c6_g2::TRINITY_DN16782_c6_g2_i1::g.76930::m.76930
MPGVQGYTDVARQMEAIRQGQWETEKRIQMFKAGVGDFDGDANKKLVDHFKNDRELLSLQINKEEIIKNRRNGFFCSTNCLCPLFWPEMIICAFPIALLACTIPQLKKAVDAHKLILREKTLLYQVDPYPLSAAASNNRQGQVPICEACECCKGQSIGFTMVIRLEKVDSIKIEQCQQDACCMPIANDTLVVRAYGSHLPVAAIDCPGNGQEFIKAVERQVEMCKASPEPLPHDLAAVESAEFYCSHYTGTSPAAAMMSAMMGQQAVGAVGAVGGGRGQLQQPLIQQGFQPEAGGGGGFCSKCGKPQDAASKFCPGCGAPRG